MYSLIAKFKGFVRCVNASVFHVAMQLLPEVLHLCVSAGGAEHPLHSAVFPQ